MHDPISRTLDEAVREHVRAVLEAHDWNMTRAARSLGIDRRTLYRKVRAWRWKRPGPEASTYAAQVA